MKWAIIAALALAVLTAILWFWARSDLNASYGAALASAREQGVERDGSLPTDERVRARVAEAARKHGLTASDDLEVSRADAQTPKGMTRLLKPAGLQVSGTTIEVRGRLRGKKLLWKLDKPFELKIVIRGNLTPNEGDAGGNRFDPNKPLPTSGDHLKRFEEAATDRGR